MKRLFVNPGLNFARPTGYEGKKTDRYFGNLDFLAALCLICPTFRPLEKPKSERGS